MEQLLKVVFTVLIIGFVVGLILFGLGAYGLATQAFSTLASGILLAIGTIICTWIWCKFFSIRTY